jgi:hypothetical protein
MAWRKQKDSNTEIFLRDFGISGRLPTSVPTKQRRFGQPPPHRGRSQLPAPVARHVRVTTGYGPGMIACSRHSDPALKRRRRACPGVEGLRHSAPAAPRAPSRSTASGGEQLDHPPRPYNGLASFG